MNKILEKVWFPIALLLLLSLLLGLVLFLQRQPLRHALEIKQRPSPVSEELSLYIEGAVQRPGWYSLSREDSLEKALRSAGIKPEAADTTRIKIYVPQIGEGKQEAKTQKININTAPSWLLQSLPRIGPALAQRIIDYRTGQGPFKSVEELTKVRGIGKATLDRIRDLITVE